MSGCTKPKPGLACCRTWLTELLAVLVLGLAFVLGLGLALIPRLRPQGPRWCSVSLSLKGRYHTRRGFVCRAWPASTVGCAPELTRQLHRLWMRFPVRRYRSVLNSSET
jgi:hypothetical protein